MERKNCFVLFIALIALLIPAISQCDTNYDDERIEQQLEVNEQQLAQLKQNLSDLSVYESIFKMGKQIMDVKDNGDESFTLVFTDMTFVSIAFHSGEIGFYDRGEVEEKDVIVPDFKIYNFLWYVSYDGSSSWHEMGSATSSDSFFFRNIYISGDYLVLRLIDGSLVKISFVSEKNFFIENAAVRRYREEVLYIDYRESFIENYAQESGYRMDYPFGYILKDDCFKYGQKYIISVEGLSQNAESFVVHVTCQEQGLEIANLTPGNRYRVLISEEETGLQCHSDTIYTNGQVRMLKTANARNMRDIGGWHCTDGRMVAYGKVFRGGAFTIVTKEDRMLLHDVLGIKTEIDLRSDSELKLDDDDKKNDLDHSLFSEMVDYYHCPLPLSNYLYESLSFVKAFNLTLNSLREGKPVFIHCAGGADRTGAVIMLFEALLGVIDSDIAKDYELTSFAPQYYDKENFRYCTHCSNVFSVFAAGNNDMSSQAIAERFLKMQGVNEKDIRDFQELMLQ